MPLASTFTLQWYGEAAAASVAVGTGEAVAGIKGRARAQGTSSGGAAITLAKPTRLVNRPATLVGAGAVTGALPKGRARPAATIRVNTLSQDDVTGAVLEALVEPGMSLKQALRITLAALAGKSNVAGGSVTFRDVNDTKDRIAATVSGDGDRTAVTLDAD